MLDHKRRLSFTAKQLYQLINLSPVNIQGLSLVARSRLKWGGKKNEKKLKEGEVLNGIFDTKYVAVSFDKTANTVFGKPENTPRPVPLTQLTAGPWSETQKLATIRGWKRLSLWHFVYRPRLSNWSFIFFSSTMLRNSNKLPHLIPQIAPFSSHTLIVLRRPRIFTNRKLKSL